MLQVKNIQKSYHSKPVLRDISFTVERGTIALFLGGSGTGKSTLLRILNGLERHDSGEIVLGNGQIGLVFQHFNLFEHLSVEENITLSLRKVKKMTKQHSNDVARALLDRYGLLDKAHESVRALSGGQKQRLAIARTLALDPEVICFDEPTSALDPIKTRQVAHDIAQLAQEGKTVLLSTHDVQLLELFDASIFLMEGGSIVSSCTTQEYRAAPSAYGALQRFLQGVSMKCATQ